MEDLARLLSTNPWAFLALAVFTTISAIQPIYRTIMWTVQFLSEVIGSGSKSVYSFFQKSLARDILLISKRDKFSADIGRILLNSLLLFGNSVHLCFALLFLTQIFSLDVIIDNAVPTSERSATKTTGFFIIFSGFALILNIAVWQVHIFYNFVMLRLLAQSDEGDLDRYRELLKA
jgi:hypothetical protein